MVRSHIIRVRKIAVNRVRVLGSRLQTPVQFFGSVTRVVNAKKGTFVGESLLFIYSKPIFVIRRLPFSFFI